jgi:hypothetical protein
VNQLLPGQVIRYTRSFFFGDRFKLPSGKKVGLSQLIGFKLQLAPPRTAPPPEEAAIVEWAMRKGREATEGGAHTAAVAERWPSRRAAERGASGEAREQLDALVDHGDGGQVRRVGLAPASTRLGAGRFGNEKTNPDPKIAGA